MPAEVEQCIFNVLSSHTTRSRTAGVRAEEVQGHDKQKHCIAAVLIIIGYKYLADGKRAFVGVF